MSFGQNNSGSLPPSVPHYPQYQAQPTQGPQAPQSKAQPQRQQQPQLHSSRSQLPHQFDQINYSQAQPQAFPATGSSIVQSHRGLDPDVASGGRSPNQTYNSQEHYFQQLQHPHSHIPYPSVNYNISYPANSPTYPQPIPPQQYLYHPQAGQGVDYPIGIHPQGLPQPHLSPYQQFQPHLSHSLSVSGSPVPYHSTPQRQTSQQSIGPVDPSLVWHRSSQPSPSLVPSSVQGLPNIPPAHPAPPPPGPSIRLRLKPPAAGTQPVNMVSSRGSHNANALEATIISSSGRPKRVATQRAPVYADDPEDDDEYFIEDDGQVDEDAEGEEVVELEPEPFEIKPVTEPHRPTRSGRTPKVPDRYGEDDFEDRLMPTSPPSPELGSRRRSGRGRSNKVILDPDESADEAFHPPPRNAFPTRTRASLGSVVGNASVVPAAGPSHTNGNIRSSRQLGRGVAKRTRHSSADAEDFEPEEEESHSDEEQISSDALGGNYEVDDDDEDDFISGSDRRSPRKKKTRTQVQTATRSTRRNTRQTAKRHDDSDGEYGGGGGGGGGRRNLRERLSKPNYYIPPPEDVSKDLQLDDAIAAVSRPNGRPGGVGGLAGGRRFGASTTSKGLPWSVKSRDLAQTMGDPDTSDSDDFGAPLKSGGAGPGPSMNNASGVTRPNAGGPSDVPNFGRVNPKSNMADADPLGVDMNVTFDNVGGLDDHINQLKEMVALPLLYPELFQQFGITPPRGVLFHGPPGTGKTLLARALAASCSTGNTKIAFFMRKGADVLSKWVGEAERQLRMLFEEARACQPSIIFFDEIDGIAPVRSSKQDQIHASLVSTLLALMDGMDGRGQVIVIGATNRPDAVDPALRRPGRFDREFYFPLPNRAARKKIIEINTRKWEPQLSQEFLDRMAMLTKGYGGADLRALCTESALNAIQRRYPQIYKTSDRLMLETKSIHVSAKDFMMSIKKIVPSSARSTSSAAVQLPPHLVPLLSAPLHRMRTAIDHVLPPRKHATALEEAEFEEEEGDSFDKHMMLQSLDKLRTFRPRILVHGEAGMGQTYLGPAILHHLEGFHVQSFDLGTLMGDSTRSVEAAVIQLIVEAKRHQPSILFIPALSAWASTVSDAARSTIRALLDGIPPSDPILVLGVSDAPVEELPGDIRALFGFAPENKIELVLPTSTERSTYFADLLAALQKPPTDFPGVLPRRKRILEALPLAPPLPPRQPTQAELQREEEKDQAARDMIFQSFVHLVRDFIKRYRKVAAEVKVQAIQAAATQVAPVPVVAENTAAVDGAIDLTNVEPLVNGDISMSVEPAGTIVVDVGPVLEPSADPVSNGDAVEASTNGPAPESAAVPVTSKWEAHNVDIETLQYKLLKHKYYTPADFLADISKIEENAAHVADPDQFARVTEMASSARYHVQGFDQKWFPEFERYKERMMAKKAERQKKKEEAAKEKAKQNGQEDGELAGDHANGDETLLNETIHSKRAREEGESVDDNQGREKRSREDDMDLDPALAQISAVALPLINGASEVNSATTSVSAELPVSENPESIEPIATVPAPAPARASTPIVHPPFYVSPADADMLRSELNTLTSNLNIEQLEQLRASLFDIIWRGRGDWDRTAVIKKMRDRLVQWGQEVESWRESGKW